MSEPTTREPGYSCPHLDGAIAEIEEARKIHGTLREWGHEWKDAYYELEKKTSSRIEELESDLDAAEDRAKSLERELRDVREELAELRALA